MSQQTAAQDTESATSDTGRRRVLSGVQPSGDPQLGNYLGAFKGWVDRQEERRTFSVSSICTLSRSRKTPRSYRLRPAPWRPYSSPRGSTRTRARSSSRAT